MHAVIGMGSNKGNPERNILAATTALEHVPGVTPIGLSSGYWSNPVGPSQPRFLNAAMVVESSFGPGELLAALLGIEAGLGRRRTTPMASRNIDLDLLLFDDHIVENEHLIVPHPRLRERAFALVPLLELLPATVDPITGKAFLEILSQLGDDGVDPPQPIPVFIERSDIDHTADLGFSVTGTTLATTLQRAAMALIDVMVDRQRVVERERHVVSAQGADNVDLMVGLLGEIIFLADARDFVPRRVSVLSSSKEGVRLAVYGEHLVREEQLKVHIKAVTYHNAAVERDAKRGRWSITVIVDV